jgi:hypothetical protein
MNPMFRCASSLCRTFSAALLIAGLSVSLLHAQDTAKRGRKYKSPPPTAQFEVTVLRATNGKPVENAAVVFHPLVDGRDSGNMELKTNDEGKAKIDLLTIGSSVRVQVIANGFQTYGEDFKVDKDTIAIEVKLNRPGKQVTIYKKTEGNEPDKNQPDAKPDAAPKSDSPDTTPKDAAPKDTPKDAPKDQAAGDAKPQDTSTPK